MALKMRLARFGAKKKPFYRIVIAETESPRDGRFVDQVGTYDPKLEENQVILDEKKVRHWLSEGVIPTDTVRSFLKKKGLLKSGA
ncbi:MAG: 30S ribosomal protein S16 [Candidatus Lernaella stagnicola]|nr:30S ribosomal protein S16 [Candidatus Lernaella stagnicola]